MKIQKLVLAAALACTATTQAADNVFDKIHEYQKAVNTLDAYTSIFGQCNSYLEVFGRKGFKEEPCRTLLFNQARINATIKDVLDNSAWVTAHKKEINANFMTLDAYEKNRVLDAFRDINRKLARSTEQKEKYITLVNTFMR